MFWRTAREEFDPKCTILRLSRSVGLFHLSRGWKTERIIDKFYYRDQICNHQSINHFTLGQRCIFMHDNDRKYTSGLIKD